MVWWKSTAVSEEHISPFLKVKEQAKGETSRGRRRVDRTKAYRFVVEENIFLRLMDLLHFVTVINYKILLLLQP
jgi:hypothetical protein